MASVVAVGLGSDTVAAIEQQAHVTVEVADVDGLPRTLAENAPVAVVAVPGSVALAQMVHRSVPAAAVLLLADGQSAQEKLTQALATAPGISRNTRCLTGSGMVAECVEEIHWAKRRARHQHTVASLQRTLAPLTGVRPEAASRYLGQLFENAPIGIMIAEPTGVIRAANPRSAAVTGRQPRDAIDTRFSALFSGDQAALAQDLITDCMSSGDTAVETLTRTGPNGTVQHIDVTIAAADAEVPSLGVIVLLHDESARIHALEAAEHARQQAEAAADRYADLSHTLQRSLLPPELPNIDGVDLAARYHAAGDGTLVGGDFYDVFRLHDGRWCVVLGDVSGKGVGAATLTSLARYSLRTAALSAESPDDLFSTLNRVLGDDAQAERFCTLAAIVLGPDGGVEVALAGHPAPTVIRRNGDLELIGEPAWPIGLFDRVEVAPAKTTLAVGDSIIVTSDGVTEARTPSGEFIPDLLDRVLPHAAGSGAAAIADAVDNAVVAVERSRTRDDVAIVVVSRTD